MVKKTKKKTKKAKDGLVTITIPTYNSEKTLRKTLESVKNQTYENIEISIVDSNSTDNTLKIAENFNAKVYQYEGTLLGARDLGARKAKGKYIMLLDSDQILHPKAIEKAVEKMDNFDMLWIYERSYKPKRIMEKLYDADRVLTQNYEEDFIEPVGGTILPRFYKKEVLVKAFENIPEKILPLCVAHDHAIIYYEAKNVSKKIGSIGSEKNPMVWHQEPWSWSNLFKKTYRYGVTTRKLVENDVYPEILKSKNKGRKIQSRDLGISIKSNILRAFRAIPYFTGYFRGKNKEIPGL